jgi:hypothetical protein
MLQVVVVVLSLGVSIHMYAMPLAFIKVRWSEHLFRDLDYHFGPMDFCLFGATAHSELRDPTGAGFIRPNSVKQRSSIVIGDSLRCPLGLAMRVQSKLTLMGGW